MDLSAADSAEEALAETTFSLQSLLRHEQKGVDGSTGQNDATATILRLAPGFTTGSFVVGNCRLRDNLFVHLAMKITPIPEVETAPLLKSKISKQLMCKKHSSAIKIENITGSIGRDDVSYGQHRHISSQPWQQKRQSLDGTNIAWNNENTLWATVLYLGKTP